MPWPYPVDAAHRYIRDLALPAAEHGEVWHRALGLKFNPAEILGSTDLHKKENDNRGSGVASGGSAKAL